MATIYNSIETAMALQVKEEIERLLDLYFGTDSTKGEVLVREINLYEKKTFKDLLEFYIYKIIFEKDQEYAMKWERPHFTKQEVERIIKQVYPNMKMWLYRYDQWVNAHSEVMIDNFRAKRSRIFKYTTMNSAGWIKVRELIDKKYETYRRFNPNSVVFSFGDEEAKKAFQEKYPAKTTITDTDTFHSNMMEDILEEIGTQYNIDSSLVEQYALWNTGLLTDDAAALIKYSDISDDDQKEVVQAHHERFINYIVFQVFSDYGYLYGSQRENVNQSLLEDTYPSLIDFQKFMNARAIAEAHAGEYRPEGTHNYEYGPKEVRLVENLNQDLITKKGLDNYNEWVKDNTGTEQADWHSTGKAFGYEIPDTYMLRSIEDGILDGANVAVEQFNNPLKEDLTQYLIETGKEAAKEADPNMEVDDSFIEPYVSEGTNQFEKQAANIDTYLLPTMPQIKYSDDPKDTYVLTNFPTDEGKLSDPTDTYQLKVYKNQYKDKNGDSYKLKTYASTHRDRNEDSYKLKNYKSTYLDPNEDSYKLTEYGSTYIDPNGDSYRLTEYESTHIDKNEDSYKLTNYASTHLDPNRDSYKLKEYATNKGKDDTAARLAAMKALIPDRSKYTYGTVASEYTPTYRTFSGHDMVVTVQVRVASDYTITKVIGAFQTISYSIHQAKYPVRVLGDMNPRRFVFGPRMIAGSIIMTVFDRHWMKELLSEYKKIKGETERYFLIDELPEMSITISAANEYGQNAKLALYGVTFINEGQVMSINDVYTENTYEFFARNIEYLDRVTKTRAEATKLLKDRIETRPPDDPSAAEVQGGGTSTISGGGTDTLSGGGSSTLPGGGSGTSTLSGGGDTTLDPNSTEPAQSYIDKITGANNYDPQAKKIYGTNGDNGELAKYGDYLKKRVDDGRMSKETAANRLDEWEKKEIFRQVTLWNEKVRDTALADLKRSYEDGRIKAANGMTAEERYQALRKQYIKAYSANRLLIIQAVSLKVDAERAKIGVTYGQGRKKAVVEEVSE